MAQNPIVTIEMEDGGKIVAELYPEVAPITVNNFISLAGKGFYDGLIFHRVISGFMIQGGDPKGVGIGGPGYCIKGEFSANGVKNDLSHKRGVLSMARAQAMDSAGSQFFIMHADGDFLDGQYAAFGKVTEGMDVVNRIASVKTNFSDKPKDEPAHEEGHRGDLRCGLSRAGEAVSSILVYRTNCPGHGGPGPLPGRRLLRSGGVLVSTGTWVRE